MRVVVLLILSTLIACSPDAGESKQETDTPKEEVPKDNSVDTNEVELPEAPKDTANVFMDTVKTNTDLNYQVLRESEGAIIGEGGVLRFHYELKDVTGKVIKSSLKNVDPYGMKLGLELVPKILDKSLSEFRYGQKVALKVPSQHPEMEKFPNLGHTEKDSLIYEIDIMEQPKVMDKDGVMVHWLYESSAAKIDSGDVIGIDYFAFDETGNIFNTSRDNGVPYEFVVGRSQVVKGLDMIFASLRQGDKVIVDIPSKHAFGTKGLVDKVKPNENVTYMLTVDYKK